MSYNNSIGWGIFGRSSGLQYKTGGCISNFNIGNIVDLHSSYILLYPTTELFCLIRENRNNFVINYYISYKYAKEIKTNRAGSFYASVLVLVNYTANQSIIANILKELVSYTSQYIDDDNRFIKDIDELQLPIIDFSNLISTLAPISLEYNYSDNEGLIILEKNDKANIYNFFQIAETNDVTQFFSKIYGTSNKEIIDFVNLKKKIQILEPATLKLTLEVQKLRAGNTAIESEFKNAVEQYSYMVNELKNQNNILNDDLQRAVSTIRELEEKVKQENNKEKVKNLQLECERIKDTNNTLVREFNNKIQELNKLSSSYAGLRQDYDKLYNYLKEVKVYNNFINHSNDNEQHIETKKQHNQSFKWINYFFEKLEYLTINNSIHSIITYLIIILFFLIVMFMFKTLDN